MPTETLSSLTAELRALGGQRVWSLMVSLFGDLAREEGAQIEGPILSAIMAEMQIKPEAARVALHRLRNDGWITSQKQGRISRHSLTSEGLRLSAEAAPRIYAKPDDVDTAWQLVLTEDIGSDLEEAGFTRITSRVFLGASDKPTPDHAIAFKGTTAPEWLKKQIAPAHLAAGYSRLFNALTQLNKALPDRTALTPMEVAVLRCLIVHNWRRLILKHPQLPSALVANDWPGQHCHVIVSDLLQRFPRPALHDLQTA